MALERWIVAARQSGANIKFTVEFRDNRRVLTVADFIVSGDGGETVVRARLQSQVDTFVAGSTLIGERLTSYEDKTV